MDEVGYDAEWDLLNSKNFGVPQNRERVFIVGHLRGRSTRKVFLIAGQNIEYSTIGKSTKTAVARTLTGGGHSGGNHSGMAVLCYNHKQAVDKYSGV
jgi:DNA (cytosine-5)-methyltransferase 1